MTEYANGSNDSYKVNDMESEKSSASSSSQYDSGKEMFLKRIVQLAQVQNENENDVHLFSGVIFRF